MIEPTPWSSGHGTYNVDDTVSSAGIAYSCNTQHTAGATLAADASKWDTIGSGSCSPAPILVIGTVYTLYFRVLDSVTGDDPGLDSTTNIVFTPPANTEVCATYNGTFTGSALQLAVVANGGNQPIYVKQTAFASTSPVQLLVGALSWGTGTRVGTITDLSLTAGSTSLTPTWSAVSGADGYQLRYKETAGTYGAWTAWTSGTNITGLTNGTSYDVQARAWSELGVSVASATVSGAPAGYLFFDDFNRADSADIGASYSYDSTDVWSISGNRIRATGVIGGNPYKVYANATAMAAVANMSVEAKVYDGNASVVGRMHLFGRRTGSTTFYLVYLSTSAGSVWLDIWKNISGTLTKIGDGSSSPFTFASGDTLQLTLNGTTISASHNGVQTVSCVDSSITAAGYGGLYSSLSNAETCFADDLVIGSV